MRNIKYTVILLFFNSILHAQEKDDSAAYVLGIFPHLPPTLIDEIFSPLAKYLSVELDRPVVLQTCKTFEKYTEHLQMGLFHIALVQPLEYKLANENYGYLPLAQRSGEIIPVIVTENDSTIRTIEDLKGHTLALPPDDSAASRIIKASLWENNINLGKDLDLKYQQDHFSCMQHVLMGFASACATAMLPKQIFENNMKLQYRILYEARPVPPSVFVVHKRVAENDIHKLKKALYGYELGSLFGLKLGFKNTEKLIPVNQSAYSEIHDYLHKVRVAK